VARTGPESRFFSRCCSKAWVGYELRSLSVVRARAQVDEEVCRLAPPMTTAVPHPDALVGDEVDQGLGR